MPREQRFGRSVLKSLEHYLSDRGLLQEGFNWKNFGQASPFVEAELMLGDSLQPFRVRFHVYIPEGLASLVERTRSEMLQVGASRGSWSCGDAVELVVLGSLS